MFEEPDAYRKIDRYVLRGIDAEISFPNWSIENTNLKINQFAACVRGCGLQSRPYRSLKDIYKLR